jgi:hypothetical protein
MYGYLIAFALIIVKLISGNHSSEIPNANGGLCAKKPRPLDKIKTDPRKRLV